MIRWAARSPIVLAIVGFCLLAWAPPGSGDTIRAGVDQFAEVMMTVGATLAHAAVGGGS